MTTSGPTFGAKSTAMEVIEGIDLKGKDAIVTGASSGIGIETVRALAKAGARVVLAVRDTEKAEPIAKDMDFGVKPVIFGVDWSTPKPLL